MVSRIEPAGIIVMPKSGSCPLRAAFVARGYARRWVPPGEMSSPSTFMVDGPGKVRFVRISHDRGGRISGADVAWAVAVLK